jgi:dipeptidyl aminopeptidase/acylaminoacyl peptidase
MRARTRTRGLVTLIATLILQTAIAAGYAGAQEKRPMTFMDVINIRSLASPAISPDGKWLIYTVATPDWKAGKRFSHIYLVSMDDGVSSTRQMTFTKDKDEVSPRWSRDSRFFVFASNRDSAAASPTQNQLYLMRPDGGEAHKITDAKDGVGEFAFSRDGKWLAFLSGKKGEQQIWAIAISEIETGKPVQITKHVTPIESWQFSPDSQRIYFLSADAFDKSDEERVEKKFDVTINNPDLPPVHLWALDLASKQETRLTSGNAYSVGAVTISKDSKWIGFRGTTNNRYMRTVTEADIYGDLYLLDASSGKIERLTDNKDIDESPVSFSPDSRTIAFSASDDFTYFRNRRVYVRAVADAGGKWRKLGNDFDGDAGINFWSNDGKEIYFNEGFHATVELFKLSVETGHVSQVTKENGVLSASKDEDNGKILINYNDPAAPDNFYTTASLAQAADKSSWRRLTDSNPQVSSIALGETEAVQWKSTDGRMVEGVLVKPVGYEKGKRYPLIVQIHGGPAGASVLNFSGNYGAYSDVYEGAGYVCLLPNYRGSTNYGEKFKMEISKEYFQPGYDDIMTGVDYLIGSGLVDPDKMGVMGWSAGGHWSNWILTHSKRFKAISSGAGAMNWTSMYAESDIQRNREFYFHGLPYDNFDYYWEISPLKYIKNASTPTLIHVVSGDPRVPMPQSEELYMALKKLGVPTEFLVYAGKTHGIPDMRGQMVKMVAEFNWFEKWIRNKPGWFEWKDLMKTLKEDKPGEEKKEPVEPAARQ